MNLHDLFKQMNIEAQYLGDQSFDTLGKIETVYPGRICAFISDTRYISKMSDCVGLVLTNTELASMVAEKTDGRNLCIVDHPRSIFFLLHNHLSTNPAYERQRYDTVIGKNCNISAHALVAAQNVTIGDNVTIEEFVSIKENVKIGNDVIIRAGSIVGGEGFEQIRNGDQVISVKHLGGVVIGDHAELQQNVCIDKAVYPWDDTVIGDSCKAADHVHVAHAVKIGYGALIAANACINGNVHIGDDAWIGPGSTLSNGITIGNHARISIGSVVTKDVGDGKTVSGNFAIDHEKFIDFVKSIR